jgi:Transcriptional regulator PadR-like family
MSNTIFYILSLLASNPKGLFGAELLALGESTLRRGSIYNYLEQMEQSKWLRTEEVAQTNGDDPRIRHVITSSGRMVLIQQAAKTGLSPFNPTGVSI